jgi:cell division protein FtsL
VLAVVACALLLMLAYPVRQYLAQRSQIASTRESLAAARERVAALEAANRRWADPGYIKAQARVRLHFVVPGETAYVVVDPHSAPGRAPGTAAVRTSPLRVPTPAETPEQSASSWFARLWASTQAAATAP